MRGGGITGASRFLMVCREMMTGHLGAGVSVRGTIPPVRTCTFIFEARERHDTGRAAQSRAGPVD